jgi:uncharacterized protein
MRLISIPLIAVFLALPLTQTVLAQDVPASITVSAEGHVAVSPDLATISLGVTTQGDTAAEAMNANSSALTAVLDRLRGAGIDDRDLQTSNLSLNPNWQGRNDGSAPQIVGYIASNMLTVRVRDLDKVGEVLDAVVSDGANTLNGISFGLSDPDPVMDKARTAAVVTARARATLLAEAAGVQLGQVLSISEGGGMVPAQPMYRMQADMAASGVPVAEGEVGISANVTMVFAIVQE